MRARPLKSASTNSEAVPVVLWGGISNSATDLSQPEKANTPVVSPRGRLLRETDAFTRAFRREQLEDDFLQFSSQEAVQRATAMAGAYLLVAAGLAVHAHVEGARNLDQLLALYLFVAAAVGAMLALRWWDLFVILSVDAFAAGVTLVCSGLAATALHLHNRLARDDCTNDEHGSAESLAECCADTAFACGVFAAALFTGFAFFGAFGVRRFSIFVPTLCCVDAVFGVAFAGLGPYGTWYALVAVMVVVTPAALLLNDTCTRFLRTEFLWYLDTASNDDKSQRRLARMKSAKHKVVQYIVHEVSGPMEDLLPAVRSATELLEALVSEADLLPPPDGPFDPRSTPGQLLRPKSKRVPRDALHREGTPIEDSAGSGELSFREPEEDGDEQPQRSPLAAARIPGQARAQSLMDKSIVFELHRLVNVIAQSAHAAHLVLGDALDMQQLEAGNFQFSETTFSVREMYFPVVQSMLARFETKGVRLDVACSSSIEELMISGDHRRLVQVIRNFLANALKFTPEQGSVLLNIESMGSNMAPPIPSERIRVAVSDTGEGMSELELRHAFTAWAQAREDGGAGLGLALSKDFIRRGHKGTISVKSPGDLGSGTTAFFIVDFPVVAPDQQSEYHPTPLAGRRVEDGRVDVLVVDDSSITRRLMAKMLRALGVTFQECPNGRAALDAMKSRKFKLVLMDKEMPVLDGHEATRAIRKVDQTIPIIGLTSYALQVQRKEFEDCGATEVLSKPISKPVLVTVLHKYHVLQ